MPRMPAQRPGRSKQDYQTPPEVLEAVKGKLGIQLFQWDLAASVENSVVPPMFGLTPQCYTEEQNSLIQPWMKGDGWNWLNPPYGDIWPWVERAWGESFLGAKTAVLVPASVGSDWWAEWVHEKAHVLLMHGRVKFVGAEDYYPKDTVVLLYSTACRGGYEMWDWR